MISASTTTVYELQKPGPTPMAQVNRVLAIMGRTFTALYHSDKTGVGAKDLSGPVGILGMLGNQVLIDYRLALSFMVLLNINLAILNLLPIPVLDGGHVIYALAGRAQNFEAAAQFTFDLIKQLFQGYPHPLADFIIMQTAAFGQPT